MIFAQGTRPAWRRAELFDPSFALTVGFGIAVAALLASAF